MKFENVVVQVRAGNRNANVVRVRSLIETFNLLPFIQVLKNEG